MKYTIENLTKRRVSFSCNSGRAFHLPPKYALEFPSTEIENNTSIEKLRKSRILSISQTGLSADKQKTTSGGRPKSSSSKNPGKDKKEKNE